MKDSDSLKQLAKKAALKAGEYLLKNKSLKKTIFKNKGRDIKLELDRSTEALIAKILSESKIPIMGEELTSELSADFFWVVDPIDGTANYFRGLDQCCVSIGLIKDGVAILGVVYNFNTNEMFHAALNKGAFLNNEKIFVSDVANQNEASLTTGFPASETIKSSIAFLDGFSDWKKIRMFGSAALSCAYVASGRCDAYIEKGVYLWDFAAGICLVKEAGGNVELTELDEGRYSVRMTNNLL